MGWNILTEDNGADPGFSHNLLSDLQGGDDGTILEYYHLTQNQHDLLTLVGVAYILHIHDSNSILFDVGATLTNLNGSTVEEVILELEVLIDNVTGGTSNHNLLLGLQGGTAGEYYHLTLAQHSEITTFFANTDLTGAEAETLSDGSNADSLHTHDAFSLTFDAGTLSSLVSLNVGDALLELEGLIGTGGTPDHNDLNGLQGGAAGQYYHLTEVHHDTLTDGSIADALHIHDSSSIIFDGGSLTSLVSNNVEDAIIELEGLITNVSHPDHNDLNGLQGGSAGQYYHLTFDQYNELTQDQNGDGQHFHDSSNIVFDGGTLTNLLSINVEDAIIELEGLIDGLPISEGTTGNNYGEMYGNNGGSIALPNTGGATPTFPTDYTPWNSATAGDLARVQFVDGSGGDPDKLRVLESGVYEVNMSISIESDTVNAEIFFLPVVNNAGVIRLLHTRHYQTTSHSGSVSISGLLDLTENDELSLYFACDNNGVVTITPKSISVLVHRVAPIVSVSWGDITGDITDQTDLITYIDNLSYDCGDILNTSNVDTGDTIQTVCDVLDYLDTKIDNIDAGDFDHNDLNALQGGNASERYHLTLTQHTDLTTGINADIQHFHDSSVIAFDVGSLTSLTSNNVEDALLELENLIASEVDTHNNLLGLQGGTTNEYFHLTSAEHSEITTFFANTDITGAEAETLTDGSNSDSLHFHDSSNIVFDGGSLTSLSSNNVENAIIELEGLIDSITIPVAGDFDHNDLNAIQGGSVSERYHLTLVQHDTLTTGVNADSLHIHDSFSVTFDGGTLSNLVSNNAGDAILELEGIIDSLVIPTIPDHNDLSGLQGGTTNEYYHLTSANHTFVTDLNSLVDANSDNLVVNGAVQVGTFSGTAQEGMIRYNPDNTFSCVEAYCNGAWVDLLGGSGGGGTDIHNNLTGLQGGTTNEYYHLTLAQHSEVTTFFANTDLTGAEAEQLSDGSNADSLHIHDSSAITFDGGSLTSLSSNNVEDAIIELEGLLGAGAPAHNALVGLQGGTTNEYYHLTSSEHSEVTTFFSLTDITGTEAETLTNGSNADTLHSHAHNSTTGLQGGTTGEYYHLTSSEHLEVTTFFANTDITGAEAEILTDGSNADSLHIHDARFITFDETSLTALSSTDVASAILEIEGLIENKQHNDLDGLQGGTTGEYYHLTQQQHDELTQDQNADTQHFHDSENITFDGGTASELVSNNVEAAIVELEQKTTSAIIEAASVPLQFVFFTNTTDYKEVSSTSYEVIGNFIFKGTDQLDIEVLKIVASRSGAGGTSSLRIFDVTNSLEIAEITFSPATKQIYIDNTLQNLPAGESIFEIQALKSSGGGSGKTRIHYVLME